MSLPHLGISPVLLRDNTDIVAGLPEERALAGQGAWAAGQLLCSAQHVPRQALIRRALREAFQQESWLEEEGGYCL